MRAKTASSEPVPFVAMLVTGSKHGKTRQIQVTPDTGASSTVVSAQTAQLLLLQVDQSRMVSLEDAQGNQLQVSGIASVYGCLEMAQDIWGSFEVIVSPALATGVLLSHMEQKFFGLIPAQWPNVCLHHQLDSKRDRVNTDANNFTQPGLFQKNNHQHGSRGRFKTSMEDLPKKICMAVDICPGASSRSTPASSSQSWSPI